jgi:hypothetical protein
MAASKENTDEIDVIDALVIDLDLDAEDIRLRESIGKPTTVRIRGMVVRFQHPDLWSTKAMQAVNGGDWLGWANEVIDDAGHYDHFEKCNLRNYQMKAIFERLQKDAGADLGK